MIRRIRRVGVVMDRFARSRVVAIGVLLVISGVMAWTVKVLVPPEDLPVSGNEDIPVSGKAPSLGGVSLGEQMAVGRSPQKFVDILPGKGSFFEDYRLERDRVRSRRLEALERLIQGPSASDKIKESAKDEVIAIGRKMEKEMEIEALIKARGYKDAIAVLGEAGCDVVVETGGLKREEAAAIGDLVARLTGLPLDKITILERRD